MLERANSSKNSSLGFLQIDRMEKTSVLGSWSKRNLPEELWPDILSCLPVKSLLRFRSVSRTWKTMIGDPDFGRLHLNRFNSRHEAGLFTVEGFHCECVVKNSTSLRTNFSLGFLESDRESLHVLRTTPAPSNVVFIRWYVFSSINGLFVLKTLRDGGWAVMLWNPSIRKPLTLPPLPGISTPSDYVDFGFGFDPSVQDFKFVRLVFAKSKTETGVKSVAIYTLGAHSWKSVEFRGECSKDLMFYTTMRPIPLNGAVYTLAVTEFETLDTKLISFDLSSEVFSSFALPASVGSGPPTLTTVDEGRTLAVVSLTEPGGSVWVLERLGDDTKSWRWIRRYSFVTQHEEASDLKFLCIKKNGEMLLKGNNVVICHNLETQQEKVMLDKTEESFVEECAFPYMESLILHH